MTAQWPFSTYRHLLIFTNHELSKKFDLFTFHVNAFYLSVETIIVHTFLFVKHFLKFCVKMLNTIRGVDENGL